MRRASDPCRILIREEDRGNTFKLPEMDGHGEGRGEAEGVTAIKTREIEQRKNV